jgi:hypothetical protein
MIEGRTAVEGSALTDGNIKAFVAAWYQALDVHAPFEEAYSLLAEEGLEMRFPDGDIRDRASFKRWYDRVTNLFFDEAHYVHGVEIEAGSGSAGLRVVVGWQASFWVPPEAKSRRTCLDATQKWVVRPSRRNSHGLEIQAYNATLEPFRYAPGFARL